MTTTSLNNLNAYDRHKFIINEFVLNRPGGTNLLKRNQSDDKTDINIIRENHQFLWDEKNENEDETWEQQLARKYYDKLFKEYSICDLTRYKENKVALRWRVEREVVEGKGQFICGNKLCNIIEGLRSWEVNFAYMELGEVKNALVKLRLCDDCSKKLNYRSQKREIKRIVKSTKKKRKSTRQSDNELEKIEETIVILNDEDDKFEKSTVESISSKKSNKRHRHKSKHIQKDKKLDIPLSNRQYDFQKHLEELLY